MRDQQRNQVHNLLFKQYPSSSNIDEDTGVRKLNSVYKKCSELAEG